MELTTNSNSIKMRINVVYLDFTSQRLTSKILYIQNLNNVKDINSNKFINKNISSVFKLNNNYSLINNDYYRINLQNDGSTTYEWQIEEDLLNIIANSLYLYVPVNSLIHDSICIGCDKIAFNHYNKYDKPNLHLNINIHDNVGLFNIIENGIK